MLVIASYYAISRVYFWSQENRLIQHGEKVQAEVMGWEVGGDAPKNKIVPPDAGIDLLYSYKGQTYRPHGYLAGRKEQIKTRTTVPLFIDPANPSRWTGRTEPASLMQELLSAMILVPFVFLFFALALVTRRQVLRIYREGEPVLAEVVSIGHSAAAPLSRMVRCAVHLGDEARIIKTVLPAQKTPAVGETLWLLAPPGRPEQGLPAALFD
jgi:hypothetical protein